jgi:hypothetical protein
MAMGPLKPGYHATHLEPWTKGRRKSSPGFLVSGENGTNDQQGGVGGGGEAFKF